MGRIKDHHSRVTIGSAEVTPSSTQRFPAHGYQGEARGGSMNSYMKKKKKSEGGKIDEEKGRKRNLLRNIFTSDSIFRGRNGIAIFAKINSDCCIIPLVESCSNK